MTEREETEMRRRTRLEACSDSHGWKAAQRAFTEVDALRRLPVITMCGDCTHVGAEYADTDFTGSPSGAPCCMHMLRPPEFRVSSPIVVGNPPPDWCPLRGT